MVNFRLVYKIIGSLLFLLGTLLLICACIAFYYNEDDAIPFVISMLFTVCCGFILKFLGRGADNNLNRRDSYLLVTATWIVFSFFGMLPFLISGYINNVTDAFFETMSGFSTTGATILDDVEWLPHATLYWRTQTQWIGGLGIVFFTIAILPSLVGGSVKVFAAEATGPIKAKMHPRLTTTAKWIWSIYLILTIGCGISFWAAGMDWFEALNYSMTTTATGGFSIYNDGTAIFQSPAIDYITILFEFLAGINFTLLYISIVKMKPSSLFKNSEFKLYLTMVLLATVGIMTVLIFMQNYPIEEGFRNALFQVVSLITTTGIFNDDIGAWPHITWIIMGFVMFLGACAGSTSGGFKCIRGVMTLKVLQNNFRQIIHPNAVLPVKVNGQSVPQSRIIALFAFFTLFVLMALITTAIMIISGIDPTNSIVIALSCVSNVGPSLANDVGPYLTWSGMADYIKWILCLLMLMGRLEIMTVLVLFTHSFWKEN